MSEEEVGVGVVLRLVGRGLWYALLSAILAVVFVYNALLLTVVVGSVSAEPVALGFGLEAALVVVGLSPPGQSVLAWLAGCRPPTSAQRAYLTGVLSAVRARTGYQRRIVVHVIRVRPVNALALGTRHVAVTEGWFGLPRDEQEAILAHELGHLRGGHSVMAGGMSLMSTAGNALGWIATWVGLGILVGGALTRGRRQAKGAGLALLVLGFALAATCMTLTVWAMWAVYSRQSEYEADAFASRHGYRRALASALARISPPRFTGRSLTNTVWASHPATWRRLRRLERPQRAPRVDVGASAAPGSPEGIRRF